MANLIQRLLTAIARGALKINHFQTMLLIPI